MDHRDRAAPVALARDAPVAQAELAPCARHRPVAARSPSRAASRPPRSPPAIVMPSRKRELIMHAVVDIGLVGDREGRRVGARRAHHRRLPAGRICWRSRGRAGRPPGSRRSRRCRSPSARNWRHRPAASSPDRTDGRRGCRCRSPSSRRSRCAACEVPVAWHSSMKAASAGFFAAAACGQRMVGRDRHEAGAEQRVGPRRVDLELALAVRRGRRVEREADQQALGAADPVLLHQPDLFRPAVERVERRRAGPAA